MREPVAQKTAARGSRFSPGGVHWFVLLAHPRRRAEGPAGARGAYVSAWIAFHLHEGALLLAKHYVRERGWRVRSVVDHRWFDGLRECSPASRRWFREARVEGACLVWHEYPIATKRLR